MLIAFIGHFCQRLPTLQRSLSTIADLLVIFVMTFPTVNQFKSCLAETQLRKFDKLTHGNFDIYLLCIASLLRKMTPIFI